MQRLQLYLKQVATIIALRPQEKLPTTLKTEQVYVVSSSQRILQKVETKYISVIHVIL